MRKLLNHLEALYIKEYDSANPRHGYNLTTGGDSYVLTAEAKQHMSEARTDKLCVLQYDLDGNLIKEYSSTVDAAKAVGSNTSNIWNCCVGICSGKRKKKTQIVKGFTFRFKSDFPTIPKHISLEITNHEKKVLQFSLDGVFIREWKSIMGIHDTLGLNNTSFGNYCNGKYRQCGGYMWRFKEDYDGIPSTIPPVRKTKYKLHVNDAQREKGKQVQKAKYGKHVYQFSLSGEHIAEYPSLSDAAKAVNGDSATITGACKGKKSKTAYGYQWRFLSDIDNPSKGIAPHEIYYGPKKGVLQYSADGVFEREWTCAKEVAEHFGINRNTVYTVLSGRKDKVKGHVFRYKDSNE